MFQIRSVATDCCVLLRYRATVASDLSDFIIKQVFFLFQTTTVDYCKLLCNWIMYHTRSGTRHVNIIVSDISAEKRDMWSFFCCKCSGDMPGITRVGQPDSEHHPAALPDCGQRLLWRPFHVSEYGAIHRVCVFCQRELGSWNSWLHLWVYLPVAQTHTEKRTHRQTLTETHANALCKQHPWLQFVFLLFTCSIPS